MTEKTPESRTERRCLRPSATHAHSHIQTHSVSLWVIYAYIHTCSAIQTNYTTKCVYAYIYTLIHVNTAYVIPVPEKLIMPNNADVWHLHTRHRYHVPAYMIKNGSASIISTFIMVVITIIRVTPISIIKSCYYTLIITTIFLLWLCVVS